MRYPYIFVIGLFAISSCDKKNPGPAQPQPQLQPQTQKAQNYEQWVNSASGLNVRQTPDLNGKKVATLAHGTKVMILETKPEVFKVGDAHGSWVRISSGKVQGWAFNGFLTGLDPAGSEGQAAASEKECANAKSEAREKYNACEKQAQQDNERCPTCEGVPSHVACAAEDMELRKLVAQSCGEDNSNF